MAQPNDFNRRVDGSWIGKRVVVDYLILHGPRLSCTLLAFDDGWLKVSGTDGEAWISPAVPVVVRLEDTDEG